jgi:hypothetical protein
MTATRSITSLAKRRRSAGDLVAHFVAHFVEARPFSIKCPTKCAIKSSLKCTISQSNRQRDRRSEAPASPPFSTRCSTKAAIKAATKTGFAWKWPRKSLLGRALFEFCPKIPMPDFLHFVAHLILHFIEIRGFSIKCETKCGIKRSEFVGPEALNSPAAVRIKFPVYV